MYLNILKKDLKRKKAMNIILLLFIILATMFVSSSVNNIINVTSALDNYFEMANAPDYLAATMNKNLAVDVDEMVREASAIDNYEMENVLYLTNENVICEDENIVIGGGTHLLHSDIPIWTDDIPASRTAEEVHDRSIPYIPSRLPSYLRRR
mgnify:CR=1 FL=1